MTEIELKSPFGDTVLLEKSGQFTVVRFGGKCPDRFQRIYDVGAWLNLEWWPMVFSDSYVELKPEDLFYDPRH